MSEEHTPYCKFFFFKHKKIGLGIITHTHLQYVSTKCYGYDMLEHMV